jgi:UDP-N-acetylmuramate dehydrogenase
LPTEPPPADLHEAVDLKDFTTWRVGGPAQWFAEPSDQDDPCGPGALGSGRSLPIRCIGAGSNLLVSDGGLPGLTLCQRRLQGSQLDPRERLGGSLGGRTDSNPGPQSGSPGLHGLEWAVGIPGTVGGAVVMNAGAQGGCTAEWLHSIQVIDPERPDQPFVLQAQDLAFAYRHSRLQDEALLVLSARFRLRTRP